MSGYVRDSLGNSFKYNNDVQKRLLEDLLGVVPAGSKNIDQYLASIDQMDKELWLNYWNNTIYDYWYSDYKTEFRTLIDFIYLKYNSSGGGAATQQGYDTPQSISGMINSVTYTYPAPDEVKVHVKFTNTSLATQAFRIVLRNPHGQEIVSYPSGYVDTTAGKNRTISISSNWDPKWNIKTLLGGFTVELYAKNADLVYTVNVAASESGSGSAGGVEFKEEEETNWGEVALWLGVAGIALYALGKK